MKTLIEDPFVGRSSTAGQPYGGLRGPPLGRGHRRNERARGFDREPRGPRARAAATADSDSVGEVSERRWRT